MSVENTNSIDFISVGKNSGVLNLTLVDPLDWSDEGRHLIQLQDKINIYLQFIESGELEKSYPDAVGRKRSINIVARFEPTEAGFRFLDLIRKLIEGAGFIFSYELRSDLAIPEE
jgi:hypothetical protein